MISVIIFSTMASAPDVTPVIDFPIKLEELPVIVESIIFITLLSSYLPSEVRRIFWPGKSRVISSL